VLTGIEGDAGEIEIELKFAAAALTVKVADDCMDPDCAVIETDPAAEPVATPAALMLAMLESEDPHCTDAVMSLEEPSERWPVALNCWLAPTPIAIELGDT
jgi:hypothetical protein